METKITFAECGDTQLTHLDDGQANHILLNKLAVLMYHEDGAWFAQGLQIDHFSQGNSEKEAQASFLKSLGWTLHEHLNSYGSLEKMLKVAPGETWQDFVQKNATKSISVSGMCKIVIEGNAALEKALSKFSDVAFLKQEEKAAA